MRVAIGTKNLLFAAIVSILIVIAAIDIYSKEKLLPALAYFYLFFGAIFLFYVAHPIYRNKRLTIYYWSRMKRSRLAVLGLMYVVALIVIAIFGPLFTQDPNLVNFEEKNLPPIGFSMEQSIYDAKTGQFVTLHLRGSAKHILGTDDKGRDMLAMLVSGARISLQVGVIATGIAIAIGAVIGVASAYFGGAIDNALMRFTDVMMTFPFFLLLVLIVYVFGANITFIILIIGLTGWTGVARIIRSEALSLRAREFVLAAKALGASDSRIIFAHLLPNVASTMIVIATLSIPGVILSEAALSFIGLGDPNVVSWGRILNAGQGSLDTTWWVAVESGLLLFLTVLAFNFIGDAARDAFDPSKE